MSARAEDAARALSREQPTTADAAVPAPANNGSADAEGVEIPAPEPSGNKNLLFAVCQRFAHHAGLPRSEVGPYHLGRQLSTSAKGCIIFRKDPHFTQHFFMGGSTSIANAC